MELQQFLRETLKCIVDGIDESQRHAMESDAMVAPRVHKGSDAYMYAEGISGTPEVVEFDVEVSTSDDKNTEG